MASYSDEIRTGNLLDGYDLGDLVDLSPAQLDLTIKELTCEITTRRESGFYFSVQYLCDYGSLRYHVLLSYDQDTSSNSTEAGHLSIVKQALAKEYEDENGAEAVERAFENLKRWWAPIVKADYLMRVRHGELNNGTSVGRIYDGNFSRPCGKRKIVKLQISTTNDEVVTSEHSEHIKWPRLDPLENTWPTLKTFPDHAVRVIERPHYRLGSKVSIHGRHWEYFYLQSLQHAFLPQFFTGLIGNLLKVQGHPRFPHIVGLKESEDTNGTVDGLLRRHTEGLFLDEIEMTKVDLKTRIRWKCQIREAAEFLQTVGIGWEDPVPADVFIEHKSQDVVVYKLGIRAAITQEEEDIGINVGPIEDLKKIFNYIALG